jgi:hypothetical protein
MQTNLPTAYVFGNANIILISLVKELLSRNLFVIVVSENPAQIQDALQQTTRNLIYEGFDINHRYTPNYIFLAEGFSATHSFINHDNLNNFYKFVQVAACKTEIILPYMVNEITRENTEHAANSAKEIDSQSIYITYLGEVFGEEMDYESAGYISNVFKSISQGEAVKVPSFDSELYLIDVKSAIDALLKGIFSYGFSTSEIVITSKTTSFGFLRIIKQFLPNLIIETDANLKIPGTISNFDFLYLALSETELKNAVQSIKIKPKDQIEVEPLPIKIPKVRKVKVRKIPRIKKRYFMGILILFWIITLPFFSLLLSSFTLKRGLINIQTHNFDRAKLYFNVSNTLANFSKTFFPFYQEGLKTTLVVNDFSKVGNQLGEVLKLSEKIGTEAQGDSSYDISSQSNQLYLRADELYRDGSYLLADIKESNTAKYFLPTFADLDKIMDLTTNARPIIKALPALLGADKKTSFLVLFQDTSDLRPTGGRIDTIGVYTFEKGRLTEKAILKTSDLDSQLKGAVAPPQALSKYLGVSNWSFEDSNWDADFTASAIKAQWFLEKETGDNVSGVIAINSNAYNNIKNFDGNILEWAGKIREYLNLKEAQIYINDNSILASLKTLNWDGGVTIPSCSIKNCLANWTGVVEANLGLNSVNSDVVRSANFSSDISSNSISNKLELNIKNSSSTQIYKAYVRVLAPIGSNFLNINGKIVPDVTQISGRTEAGTYVIIPAGASSKLVFSWIIPNTLKFNEPGQMLFYMRKQPGISIMPTNITFTYPPSLTAASQASYTTSLTNDFSQIIKW